MKYLLLITLRIFIKRMKARTKNKIKIEENCARRSVDEVGEPHDKRSTKQG